MPIREQAQEPRGRPIHEWAVPVHESVVPIYELDLVPGGTIHELVLFSASSCSVPKYQCPSSKWQFLRLGTPEKSTEREQDSEIRTRSYSGTSSCMGKSHLCTGNFYVWVLTFVHAMAGCLSCGCGGQEQPHRLLMNQHENCATAKK